MKILKSLFVVLAMAAMVVGATSAYFTDQKTVAGMTFATGTLKMTDASEGWTKTVSFANLKPGDSIRKWVVLENTGTLDIASLKVSAVNVSDPSGLLPNVKISLIGAVNGYDNAYYTPDWTGGAMVDSFLTGAQTDILDSYFYSGGTPAHVLAPGSKDTIILDFSVPTTAGNDLQGLSASFDLQFDAEQSHTGSSLF